MFYKIVNIKEETVTERQNNQQMSDFKLESMFPSSTAPSSFEKLSPTFISPFHKYRCMKNAFFPDLMMMIL
jgi:hypothetical protein